MMRNSTDGCSRPKLVDLVSDYASDEIALTATVGDCESGSSDYYLLTVAGTKSDSDVVIYLNSFGATDVFYQIGPDVIACDLTRKSARSWPT